MATANCDAWYFDTKTSLTNVTLSNVDTTNVDNIFVTIQAENTDSDSTLVTATSAEIGTLNISDGKLYFDWTDGKAGTQERIRAISVVQTVAQVKTKEIKYAV